MATYLRIAITDAIYNIPLTFDSQRPESRYGQPVLVDPDGEILDGSTLMSLQSAEIITDDRQEVCRSLGLPEACGRVVQSSELDEEDLSLIGLHPWGSITAPVVHRRHPDARI